MTPQQQYEQRLRDAWKRAPAFDEHTDVVQDGQRVTVELSMMDAQQRSVADDVDANAMYEHRLVNAWRNA